jgi:hypothetical protein
MSRGLDWKWILLGVVIMFGLSFVAGLIMVAVIGGAQVETAAEGGALTLSGGQALLAVVLNFLAFLVGGYIVGARSAGRTILEPGLSAAIAVAIGLAIAGNFGLGNLLAAGVVPFLAGLLGGWLGERRRPTVDIDSRPLT